MEWDAFPGMGDSGWRRIAT